MSEHIHSPERIRLMGEDREEIPGRWYRCSSCRTPMYEAPGGQVVLAALGAYACGCKPGKAWCRNHACSDCWDGGRGPLCETHSRMAREENWLIESELEAAMMAHPAGKGTP